MAVISRDGREASRFLDDHLVKLPVSVCLSASEEIEAIDQGYLKPFSLKKTSNEEEAEGPCPKIVSSEVSDPWVDEKNVRGVFHVKHT